MSRYVDVDKAIENIDNIISKDHIYIDEDTGETLIKVDSVFEVLENIPTADVEEVRHAKWIKDERQRRDDGEIYDYCCSLCKGTASKGEYGNYDVLTDFCPHCGAKMDLTLIEGV